MEQLNNYSIVVANESNKDYLIQASDLISQYAQNGLMLPQSVDALKSMANKKHLVLAISDDRIIGTAALTVEYPDGSGEFGGWAVDKKCQGLKIGKAVFNGLILVQETLPYPLIAFGNQKSGAIFENYGAKPIDQNKVHPDAFKLCALCKCKGKSHLPAGVLCTDTIYDLTPLAIKVISQKLHKQEGDVYTL